MLGNFFGVFFDGIVYGSFFFFISVGLLVMMGMMNFINFVYGVFVMLGGYVCVMLFNCIGVFFLVILLLVFIVVVVVGLIFECFFYCCFYKVSYLDQVLFFIGLIFMVVVGVIW